MEFAGGKQPWESKVVGPSEHPTTVSFKDTLVKPVSPASPVSSSSFSSSPSYHLSSAHYPPLPSCSLHQQGHLPPTPPEFTVKKPRRSQRCAARAVAGPSTAPPPESPPPALLSARSSTPSSDSSKPKSQAFQLVDAEEGVLPIRIEAPSRAGSLKTLLLSTTPTGALIPVEIAIHFGTEEERDLPLFFRKDGEFLPVSLKVEDLIRLVAVAPVPAPFERASLLSASSESAPEPLTAPIALVVPRGSFFSGRQAPAAFGSWFLRSAPVASAEAPASVPAANDPADTSAPSALSEPYLIPVLPALPAVLVPLLPRIFPPPAPIVGPRRSHRKKKVPIF